MPGLTAQEGIRLQELRSLQDLVGSGIWQGDLAEIREDQPDTESDQP